MTYNEITPNDVEPVAYKDVDIDNIDLRFYTKITPKNLMKAGRVNGDKYRTAENLKGPVYENSIPMSFDIETTGVSETDPITHKITQSRAYMYKWQVGIGDNIIHGRTYTQLLELFNALAANNSKHIICRVFVANLGYEFQFVNHWLQLDGWKCRVFARVTREPITATFAKNGFWLMFADALQISNSGLAKLAENYNLPSKKQVGDLDYSKPRNSKTPLTPAEIGYCSYDCRVLNDFYRWLMLNYVDNGLKFPLTSTGLVRSDVKTYFRQFEQTTRVDDNTNKRYVNKSHFSAHILPELWPTYAEYCELMDIGYCGGYTHANVLHAGRVLENINGGDFTSSYPYTIMFQKFPMSPFLKTSRINSIEHIQTAHARGWAVLAKIRFYRLEQTSTHSTISITKCYEYIEMHKNAVQSQKKMGGIVDNGRIVYAECITLLLTDLDVLENISRFYKWRSCEIIWAKTSKYGYLPDYVRYACAMFYQKKQKLKQAGLSDTSEYRITKSMVNSIYGMMVQKLNIYEVIYDGDNWGVEIETVPGLTAQQNAELMYIKSLYNSRGEFAQVLSPYWGVWVTSHARGNLFTILASIGEDAVYCDTDSIYYLNPDKHIYEIRVYNDRILKHNVKLIENWNAKHEREYQLDPECFKDLGEFDKLLKEGDYSKFKTLGAKRYVKQWGDNIEQTIAGLPKTALAEYCKSHKTDPFKVFDNNMRIPECKNAHKYNDKPHSDTITDEVGNTETMTEYASVGLFPIDFTMSVTGEYAAMITAYAEKRSKLDYIKLFEITEEYENDKPGKT